MTFLKAANISKKGEGDFLLSKISFSQRKLEKIAIAGETGAGKSTLLRLIAGLIQPDSGELWFEKKKITGPDDQLVPGHPGIAYLSQHFELQKFLRVEQVLSYSNSLSDREAGKLYDVCQISHLLKRKTDQLSGGEKQRIAICRLLISSPGLLLLDEPFSHLDMVHKNTLKSVIRDIGEKLKITCILVSHDPQDTLSWADKILVMKDGQIIQKGKPEKIYKRPVNEYTGGLFGNYNIIHPESFKAFSQLKAMKEFIADAGKKSIFLRPEHFKLVKKSKRAIRGTVESVEFVGSYCEMDILISKTRIRVRSEKHNIKNGAAVYISVSPQDLRYV
ncbi:MAG: ABC transporter ATP-binding protein [Cyclobacteriaceae bacterium]